MKTLFAISTPKLNIAKGLWSQCKFQLQNYFTESCSLKATTIVVLMIMNVATLNSQTKYILPMTGTKELLTALNKQRIIIAKSQLGIREEKKREAIKEYLLAVGIKDNNAAWCNAFQYWVMEKACKEFNLTNPMEKSGLANSTYIKATKIGYKVDYKPAVGDLLVWKNVGSWTGHIGLITKLQGEYNVTTIEGNTSSYSVRTGGAVEQKTRSIMHPIGKLKVRGLIGVSNG